jgi:hypothetical protein
MPPCQGRGWWARACVWRNFDSRLDTCWAQGSAFEVHAAVHRNSTLHRGWVLIDALTGDVRAGTKISVSRYRLTLIIGISADHFGLLGCEFAAMGGTVPSGWPV